MDLQWELEGLEEAAGPRPPSHCEDRLISAHLSFLLRPETREAEQLARAVELCSLQHSLRHDGRPCSVPELAAALAARGFAAHVCRSAGGGAGTAAFRNLRHTFITVCGAGCGAHRGCCGQGQHAEAAGGEAHDDHAAGGRLLVDPHFKCSFTVAAPTPRFARLHALLPQCFVGSPEQLSHLVEWVCSEMAWSFRLQHTPLPPWREYGAMLTKWRPRRAAACEPAAAASPPGSPPAPCCCAGAPAPGAPAAAGLDEERQAAQAPQLCRHQHQPTSPCSILVPTTSFDEAMQQAAAWACGARGADGADGASMLAPAGRSPVSLLSRSLEPLRRAASTCLPSPPGGHCWWEPRTVKVVPVRRSGP